MLHVLPKKNARGPVSRVLSIPNQRNWATIPLGRRLRAASSNQPGRRGRAAPYAVPTRSCSRWGLPCRCRYRKRGALLPHPFALTGPKPTRSAFCCTVPKARVAPRLAGRYPAPSLCGARTFLPCIAAPAAARPSGGMNLAGVRHAEQTAPAQCGAQTAQPCSRRVSAPLSPPVSSDSRIARHSPSITPSTVSGRKRRWNARTAGSRSITS